MHQVEDIVTCKICGKQTIINVTEESLFLGWGWDSAVDFFDNTIGTLL